MDVALVTEHVHRRDQTNQTEVVLYKLFISL